MYSIDFQRFKPSDGSPRRLGELDELRHVLLGVRCEDGQCIANFPNGEFIFPEEMRDGLRELVGREIACLRLDGKIYIRVVDSD